MTVTINGTTGVSLCAASSVPSTALQSGVPSRSQLPAGTVLQVVQSTSTSTYSSTSTSFASTFTATITPTSASNKILAIASCELYQPNAGVKPIIGIARNGTVLIGDLALIWCPSAAMEATVSNQLLDSPATKSSVTYSIQLRSSSAGTHVVMNPDSTVSSLTLMEIAV